MNSVNPEYLFDGLLFETPEAWRKAFEKDPERALGSLRERRLRIEKALATLDLSDTFSKIDDLIASCRKHLKALVGALPKEGSLFPDAAARKAVLPTVCEFFSRISEMQEDQWHLMAAFSVWESAESPFPQRTIELLSSLLPATSGAEGLAVFTAVEAELQNLRPGKAAVAQ